MSAVLAFSGGIDSTAILATRPVNLCVFVDYGQPAATAERRAARELASRFDVPLQERSLPGMALGAMSDESGLQGPRIVQARNLAIAALCMNEMPLGGTVLFGAHRGDAVNYPDCRPEFWDSLSLASVPAYGCHVSAPFIDSTKLEVTEALARVVRNYDVACWSCYTPRAGEGDRLVACMECSSCRERE